MSVPGAPVASEPVPPASHPRSGRRLLRWGCSVTTTGGQPVPLEDANPYLIDQKGHMETDYGFDLSSGVAYLVTCGSRGATGEFAVVEIPILPRVVATILMVPGVIAFVAGIASAVVARRRRRKTSGV